MEDGSPCPTGAGGVPKAKITHALIKDIVAKALNDMGYECPKKDSNKFVRTATPTSSRTSSSTTTPTTSASSSRSNSPSKRNKRRPSSLSDNESTSSDSTVVGSDSESQSAQSVKSDKIPKDDTSFTLVEGKNRKATPRSSPRSGSKPAAPPRSKLPPIFLRKGANFLKISADCTRLRINYSKAVRTADDGIKIFCSDVETFRSLNKYLVDSKVQFHTYALEEERKIKAVIRGIPTDFPVEEIQTDLRAQGFPVHSVHRLCRRDGSPLWCVASRYPSGGPTSGAAVPPLPVIRPRGRHADPRCVKCLVPHRTRECPLTRESGEKPFCVNCGQQHTANYRGCPKAPKFNPQNRPNPNRPKSRPIAPPRDLNNFPDLPGNKPSPLLPPLAPPPLLPTPTAGTSSFGEDVQTVMAVLRAVSSSEISEFARDLRACRSVDEKVLVLVSFPPVGGRRKPKNITLLSLNANGLSNNILELTKCMSEYGVDIALIQETFLKPNRPRACTIAGYAQLRTDRTHASKGGTALYYSRSLHCCPIDIPPLINMEATGCRLAVRGHRTLVIVSVYLPSPQPLHRRDLALLALGDAVILFGSFNCKNPRWGCPVLDYNGDKLDRLQDRLE
ncbi:Nucleic-acid-binding protein from transposon X-element [Eumeta japonica]|uniref:Nucleic-acid-binding protein from transposon X-element n=1 Tax=Eumeta variegata TaxID=151549 RepID=A0A4C1XYK3_EUMVA|nr:Nucleic-acid-binding protein from transposon X-element [Eumeta japonica]